MEKKSLKYYGAFLLIVASAIAYLLTARQPASEPTQPALVTQSVTERVIEETTSPTTTATAQPSVDAFKDLEKESDSINSLDSLLN